MKNTSLLISIFLSLVFVSVANAADKPRYRGVSIDEGATYFLDVASVKVRNGTLTGWIATEERESFQGAFSTHFLVGVNCKTDEFWVPTSIYYSANGLRGQIVKNTNWGDKAQRNAAPPGSLAESWVKSICGIQKNKNLDLVPEIQNVEVSRRAARQFYDDDESALASGIYPNIR